MIFAISFLGALFAILASLLLVYSYVMLRLIPRFKKSLLAYIEEIGPRAIFEKSGVDPAQMMRDLGIDVIHPSRRGEASSNSTLPAANALRVVFTCEDHGRCAGCPKVLAQFEAIILHQGAESFDEVERRCYEQLRDQIKMVIAEDQDGTPLEAALLSDDAIADEDENARQHRIAAGVIDALIREGVAAKAAREVVWSRSKEDRATFVSWLSAAHEGCQSKDEEVV